MFLVVKPSRSAIANIFKRASFGPGPSGASGVAFESSRTDSTANKSFKSVIKSSWRRAVSCFQSIVMSLKNLSV